MYWGGDEVKKSFFLRRESLLGKLAERYIIGKVRFQRFFEALHLISVNGLNYCGRGASVDVSGEEWVVQWFRNQWNRPEKPIVFDIGANVGAYTRTFLSVFGEACSIYAFEPSETAFKVLRANVSNPSVCCFNLGFSDESRQASLYCDSRDSTVASVYLRDGEEYGYHFVKSATVQLETLDEFCEVNNIERINFLKMDVEGHELSVLQGGQNLLESGAIDVIQFEFGPCNMDSRTYFRDFYKLLRGQYDICRVCQDGLYPIQNYTHLLEVFRTSNFIAELRTNEK